MTFDAHYRLQSNRSNFLNLDNPYDPNQWNREQFASREKLVLSAMIQLPWGKGRRYLSGAPAVVDHPLGGWDLIMVSHFKSGQWFSPAFSGSDPSNTNTSGGLRDRIANGNLLESQREVERWFDPAAFAVPPAGRFGNSGVNILEGPD